MAVNMTPMAVHLHHRDVLILIIDQENKTRRKDDELK